MVSFTSQLSSPQSHSGLCGIETNFLAWWQWNRGCPASSPSAYPMSYPGSWNSIQNILRDLCISLKSCYTHLEHKTSVKRFVSLLFLNLRQSVGLFGRGISPSKGRYLHRPKQAQNKRTQTSMSRVGFEPTIPVFEGVKTFHALDSAATVIGILRDAITYQYNSLVLFFISSVWINI
jgi:hypothetical protein